MIKAPKVGDRCWHVNPETNRLRLVTVNDLDSLPKVTVRCGFDEFQVMRKDLFRNHQAAMIQTYVNHCNKDLAVPK